MADNFRITAERAGKSSATLHQHGEYFNACYFGGYVIECYQKLILQLLTNNNPAAIHELDELKKAFKTANNYTLQNSSRVQRYNRLGILVDIERLFNSIFSSWHPRYRYSDSHTWDAATSAFYQNEIKRCGAIIAKMRTNGLIN